MLAKHRIIVALDVDNPKRATSLIKSLASHVGYFKIGREMQAAFGLPQAIDFVHAAGGDIFLDGKENDIPNTVAATVRVIAQKRVAMLNVHCLGGEEMMRAAAQAAREVAQETGSHSLVLGVTLLTSQDYGTLQRLGFVDSLDRMQGPQQRQEIAEVKLSAIVNHLAVLAKDCGLNGVICSPKETEMVRGSCGDDFCIVNPGIRPAGTSLDDQKRVGTPAMAIKAGATHLVIGRPITGAADPVAAAIAIAAEIEAAQAV